MNEKLKEAIVKIDPSEDNSYYDYLCDQCAHEETCEQACIYFRDIMDELIEESGNLVIMLENLGVHMIRNVDITDKQMKRFGQRMLSSIDQSGVVSGPCAMG